MTHLRPFRNSDSPALRNLWNRGAPSTSASRPLTVHEFDSKVLGGPLFDAAGLIVAERDRKLLGFVHAGFGPRTEEDSGIIKPLSLSRELGTVAMLIIEPDSEEAELANGLLISAERYLRDRGASVIYAGGQYPLNPFYWGVYGGSEWAGVLTSHAAFQRAVTRRGYEPVSTTVLLEVDLTGPEVRDPRSVLIRRLHFLEITEDATPPTWWDNLAVGEFRPTLFRLMSRQDQSEVARATTWDMSWFGRIDNLTRVGLIDMRVRAEDRRKGYGRHLVKEILHHAREEGTAALAVQTRVTNTEALALYESIGFVPVETATLFRLPGGLSPDGPGSPLPRST